VQSKGAKQTNKARQGLGAGVNITGIMLTLPQSIELPTGLVLA
jgi:hypothetical protein